MITISARRTLNKTAPTVADLPLSSKHASTRSISASSTSKPIAARTAEVEKAGGRDVQERPRMLLAPITMRIER
jgi:hypothetical protein